MPLPGEFVSGELSRGDVVWVSLDPIRGREQSGHRPVVVIASNDYLDAVTALVIIVPITSRDRGWPNHVLLSGPSGLQAESWAMSEQPRTISRDRITGRGGRVDSACLDAIGQYFRDFLEL